MELNHKQFHIWFCISIINHFSIIAGCLFIVNYIVLCITNLSTITHIKWIGLWHDFPMLNHTVLEQLFQRLPILCGTVEYVNIFCAVTSLFVCLCLRVWASEDCRHCQPAAKACLNSLSRGAHFPQEALWLSCGWLWRSLHVTALRVACFPSSLWGPLLSQSILLFPF